MISSAIEQHMAADSEEEVLNYSSAMGPLTTYYQSPRELPPQKSHATLAQKGVLEVRRNLDPALYGQVDVGRENNSSHVKRRTHKNKHRGIIGRSVDLTPSQRKEETAYTAYSTNQQFKIAPLSGQHRVFRGGAKGAMALRLEKEEKKQVNMNKAYTHQFRSQ